MKKDESILNILMYLFHQHMEKGQHVDLNNMELVDELKSAGFHTHNIGKAFRWLHSLTEMTDQQNMTPSENTFRVFNEQEYQLMSDECRGFIMSLEQQGVLTPFTREIVIHQTLELINEGMDLSLLKWVTLMVLFNLPNCETALSHMEFLVLSNAFDTIH